MLIVSRDRVETAFLDREPMPAGRTRNLNAMEILQSRMIAEDVIRSLADSPYRTELSLMQETTPSGRPISFDSRAGSLRSMIGVSLQKDTDVLKLTVTALTPFEAAFLANAVSEQFYRYSLQSARGELTDIRQFLEQQPDVARSASQPRKWSAAMREPRVSRRSETVVSGGSVGDFHAFANTTQTELNAQLRRQDYCAQLAEARGTLLETSAAPPAR
jgi:hypothetical protein